MSCELSIIIFAYNEGENVDGVLSELLAWKHSSHLRSEVVFVDDGSSDDTATRAEAILVPEHGRVLRRASNGGIGAALKTGVTHARGGRVTFLPCDGQIPPSAIDTLMAAATTDDPDVVLSVYESRDDGAHRTVLSAGVRGLIALVHGVLLKSDGPYLFRRSLFLPNELPPDSFFLNFEFPIRARAAGLKIQTVTIPCRKRRAGASKSARIRRVKAVTADLVDLRVRRLRETLERALGRRLA